MNKKGVVADDMPPLRFAVIGVGILILIALVAKTWNSSEQEKTVTSLQQQIDLVAQFHDYLQSDIEHNTQKTVASFMLTATDANKDLFTTQTLAFFDQHLTTTCWYIQVRVGGSPLLDAGTSYTACNNRGPVLFDYS